MLRGNRNEKNISKFDYFVLSFREIWKFDKLLFIVLLTDVVINALLPFPNIILSGLIIETLTEGSKFLSFAFYVGLMFSMNFFPNPQNSNIKSIVL